MSKVVAMTHQVRPGDPQYIQETRICTMAKSTRIYVSLASSQGDRITRLRSAIRHLATVVTIERVSHLYAPTLEGKIDPDATMSAVVVAQTSLQPLALLKALKAIERDLGRPADAIDGSAIIDLDLLFYGSMQIESLGLTVPHPRMQCRAEILKPLFELEPRLMHPVLHYTIAEMLGDVPEANLVQQYRP